MCEYLPYSDIKINNDILIDDVLNTSDETDIGYMVEVDLSFPKQIHGLLKQFVPCPEHITPNKEWFSDYQKEVQALTHANTTTTKLVAHVYDRTNYTLHYRNLRFSLSLKVKYNSVDYSIILGKVHNLKSFNQSPWMKPFSLGNTDLRKMLKMSLAKLVQFHA